MMQGFDKRTHCLLVLLLAFVYVGLGTLHRVTMNYFTWFAVLHLLTGYMRLYPRKIYNNRKVWGTVALTTFLLSGVSIVVMCFVDYTFGLTGNYHYFVSDSNTCLALITGISSFLFIKNVHIGYNRTINTIAASTFGVLMIHANSDTMRRWLWRDMCNCVGMYELDHVVLRSFATVLVIFTVCVLIDVLRIQIIEKPFLRWWDHHESTIVRGVTNGYQLLIRMSYNWVHGLHETSMLK